MAGWLPVPGTTTGRLVEAALALFGAQGFEAVPVAAIAAHAGVTTGPLYHHFGDKAGLYRLVRADVEQRVLDRMDGAAAVHPARSLVDLADILLPGFDYLVRARLTRLLGEPARPDPVGTVDAVEAAIDELLAGPPRVGFLVAASWRAALWEAGAGPASAQAARRSLVHLLTGTAASTSENDGAG